MWVNRLSACLAVLLLATACGGGSTDESSPERGPGAGTPQAAVRELIEHLNAGDFGASAQLAVPNQAALASLAEAATFGEVAEAIRTSDVAVAANFWSGFAQGTGSFLIGNVSTNEGTVVTESGVEFSGVLVIPESQSRREMITRDVDGYRVDLFASFGGGLAGRMIPPVERLLTTDSEDARLILAELQKIVPSLTVATAQPGLPPDSAQHLVQLIELITRLG